MTMPIDPVLHGVNLVTAMLNLDDSMTSSASADEAWGVGIAEAASLAPAIPGDPDATRGLAALVDRLLLLQSASANEALAACRAEAARLAPAIPGDPAAIRGLMALVDRLLLLQQEESGKTPRQTLQEIALTASNGT
jgi:hypothetical protein